MPQGTSRRGAIATLLAASTALAGAVLLKVFGGRDEVLVKTATTSTKGRKARALQGVFKPGAEHWVGDGFYVRTVFSPEPDAQMLSPFLLLDHAARKRFDPSPWRRGVGEHPHRIADPMVGGVGLVP